MMMSPLPDTIGSQFSHTLGFLDTNTSIGYDDVTTALHHRFSAFERLLQKNSLLRTLFSYQYQANFSFWALAMKNFTFTNAFFIPVSGKCNLIFARHWLVLPIYIAMPYPLP
jgi:hypothetical protein